MTRDRARKAAVREHAEATATNYARAAHMVGAPDVAIAPPEVWIEVDTSMGPNWGGDLHSHIISVTIGGQSDGGRGAWLRPEDLPDGPQVLEDALRLLPDSWGGYDLDLHHLYDVVRSQLPDAQIDIIEDDDEDFDRDDPAREEWEALQEQNEAQEQQDVVLLLRRDVTWNCEQAD